MLSQPVLAKVVGTYLILSLDEKADLEHGRLPILPTPFQFRRC
jgi:hypothetical protein